MFLKLGQQYAITLFVVDINGNRIVNDSPYVTIKDKQTNMYWNGFAWQSSELNIIMAHIDNGVYSYNFTSISVGVLDIKAKSDAYSIEKSINIEVFDDNIMKYNWPINTSFLIKYTGSGSESSVHLKICKGINNTFWDGTQWSIDDTTLAMPVLLDNVHAYTFTPNTESEYMITIYTDTDDVFFIINATTTADNVPPVHLNQNTLKSLDGTDSVLVNEKGDPLSGVDISIFDADTKESVGKVVTNANGEWNVMIKPGKYYFMFDRVGYISVGFERTVT